MRTSDDIETQGSSFFSEGLGLGRSSSPDQKREEKEKYMGRGGGAVCTTGD